MTRMRPRARLFAILWLAGFAGVLSLLLLDIEKLVRLLPVPADAPISPTSPLVRLLSVVQPAIFLTVAVALGVFLAHKVGLMAPAAQAAADGAGVLSAFKAQLVPGLVGGLIGGTLVVLVSLVTKPLLPPAVTARIAELGQISPLPMRLLYGGITEELLLRWGLMTLLVWLAWRWFQRGQGQPAPACFVGAIVVSSLVFGLGHLPIAFMLVPNPTAALIGFVIVANSSFGLIAGFLYWKSGLEAAIVAHMVTHLVMFAASRAGAYF